MIIYFFSCKQHCQRTLNLHLKSGVILSQTYKDMTLYPHMYQNVFGNLLQKKLQYTGIAFNSRNDVNISLSLVPF